MDRPLVRHGWPMPSVPGRSHESPVGWLWRQRLPHHPDHQLHCSGPAILAGTIEANPGTSMTVSFLLDLPTVVAWILSNSHPLAARFNSAASGTTLHTASGWTYLAGQYAAVTCYYKTSAQSGLAMEA